MPYSDVAAVMNNVFLLWFHNQRPTAFFRVLGEFAIAVLDTGRRPKYVNKWIAI